MRVLLASLLATALTTHAAIQTNTVEYGQGDATLNGWCSAVHSLPDWNAEDSAKGAQYDKAADERSWEHMKRFLVELFK